MDIGDSIMKRSRIRNIIAAFLSAAVIISAGCGNKLSPAQTTPAAAAAVTEAATTTTTADVTTTTAAAATAAGTSADENAPEATTDVAAFDKAERAQETNEYKSYVIPDESEVTDTVVSTPEEDEITPALWKVTDPENGSVLYMIGTFHATLESTYPLPDYIEDIYESSDGIAVEYNIMKLMQGEDLDMEAVRALGEAQLYLDGTELSDHISGECYEALKGFAEDCLGGWNELYDHYTVGTWISTISTFTVANTGGFDFSAGIDRYFIGKAKADGKEIVDIEPLSAQIGVINAYTDKLGEWMINTSLSQIGDPDSASASAEVLEALYDAWKNGDPDIYKNINESSEESGLPDDLKEDYELYNETVYYSRNRQMAEKAAEFMKNGDNLFFMVGFLHFAGDRSVIAVLEDMGYTVEKLH